MLKVSSLERVLFTQNRCITINTVDNIGEEIFGIDKRCGVCATIRNMQEMLKKTKREEIHRKMPNFVDINYPHLRVDSETNNVLSIFSVQ